MIHMYYIIYLEKGNKKRITASISDPLRMTVQSHEIEPLYYDNTYLIIMQALSSRYHTALD